LRRGASKAPEAPLTTGATSWQLCRTVSLIFIRVCAVLIGLRSLTNFAKLFQGSDAVVVFFGQILRGGNVGVPAFAVGLFMLVTAIAMWRPLNWAFPLVAAYAAYVAVNLLLWTVTNPGELVRVGTRFSSASDPTHLQWVGALGMLGYSLVAIATTAGPAWLLWKRRRMES
jgi:hypothetical protein